MKIIDQRETKKIKKQKKHKVRKEKKGDASYKTIAIG